MRTGTAFSLLLATVLLGARRGALADDNEALVYRLEGSLEGDLSLTIGDGLAVLGDLDRDGVKDFATTVGWREKDVVKGSISLHSGKDGKRLKLLPGPVPDQYLYELHAFPDLDGDGLPELAVPNPDFGFTVVSPVAGTEWYRTKFPERYNHGAPTPGPNGGFLVGGDVDDDLIPDVFCSNYGEPIPGTEDILAGVVALISGRTGAVLWDRFGPAPWRFFGREITTVGDVDGDSIPDLLASETRSEIPPPDELHERTNQLQLLSGRTGAQLALFPAPGPRHFGFGEAMTALDDLDGDGQPEVAIAAPYYRDGRADSERLPGAFKSKGRFLGWVGVFKVHRDRLELLHERSGSAYSTGAFTGDQLGYSLGTCADLDGDGARELLVEAPHATPDEYNYARLEVCSGRTGRLLHVYAANQIEFDRFFARVSGLDDLDGDGRTEILTSSGREFVRTSRGIFQLGAVAALRLPRLQAPFLRGDANQDGRVNVADALEIFKYALAHPGGIPARDLEDPTLCLAAYDIAGYGWILLDNGVRLLHYLFEGERPPIAPFPECSRITRVENLHVLPELWCFQSQSCEASGQ